MAQDSHKKGDPHKIKNKYNSLFQNMILYISIQF